MLLGSNVYRLLRIIVSNCGYFHMSLADVIHHGFQKYHQHLNQMIRAEIKPNPGTFLELVLKQIFRTT